MSDFLNELGNQINSQFSLGENEVHSLDGQNKKYGSLGDYSKKFDQSAQRKYVEEGYLRKDPYNTSSKKFEILVQEPNATVLLKKKMFSSIGENFRPDFMDKDEKLYYRAIQTLFQNKCLQISALEKLSKIQKITNAVGQINEQLIPIIITLSDTINNGLDSGSNSFGAISSKNPFTNSHVSDFTKVIDRLRRVYAFNTTNQTTTWITDATNLFRSQIGQGTGVIELTNFTRLDTTTSVSLGGGSFSFSISDPYEIMLITEYDIEKAISEASNSFYNHKSFQFGLQGSNQVIQDAQRQLNKARSARKASPITFKINPDTLLSKRVVAIVDRTGEELIFTYDPAGGLGFPGLGGAGNSVTVSDEYLKDGSVLGFDGLDTLNAAMLGRDNNIKKLFPDSELSIFKRLVAAIFNKIQLEANSRNAFQVNNKNTNYVRRKLRFNFSGKLIIQPMDTVHIYMDSKSRYDAKLLSGVNNMFSGVGILQNLNNTLTDFKNASDTLFNPSGSIPIQIEKSVYVGSSFPNFLWSLLRSQFVTEKEGTHVFGGVIVSAGDNYQDGKFTIDVNGKDNSYYFEQGKINFKPGVDNFNGAWFDPLTPFKSNFDNSVTASDVPELLDENKFLLGLNGKTSLVKHKLGPYAGEKVTSENYIQDQSVDNTTGLITKVFYAPDGLVYKWKEGIGVFTQFGSSSLINDSNKVGNANTFNEPFAGLDVMNVLSLLIAGVPYNFENYFKVTQNSGGLTNDPQSKQDAAYSYINSLKNDLQKSNVLWGNFIPFKNLIMDEQSFIKNLNAQFRINEQNRDLDNKIQQLADLNKKAIIFGSLNIFSDAKQNFNANFLNAKAEASVLASNISDIISNIQKTDYVKNEQSKFDSYFKSSFTDFNEKDSLSNAAIRRHLRRQTNLLTRRMSYDVRANEDKNLFIVDDYYDKDYDIMAYNQALTDGIKLYNNEFSSVRDKIDLVSNLLNLEVFCDTQGHIRVRPPQYNRMPSSIFYRMMFLKQSFGIQIFPQFLSDFFGTQLETLRERLEVIEDQIRLDCAILGYKESNNSDDDALRFIRSSLATEGSNQSFNFISDTNGLISDIGSLLNQANPDTAANSTDNSFANIEGQKNINSNNFTNVQRYSTIVKELKSQNLDKAGLSTKNASTLQSSTVNDIISRLQTKSGQKISVQDYVVSGTDGVFNVELPINTIVDVLKTVNELSAKIQERQTVLKLFYSTIKNATEFKSLDDKNDNTGNELLTPGIFGNSHIPEVYEHMIEDETYDDYGVGSGTRYIIKRSQIKSLRISENPPPYTAIEVQGTLNTFAPGALPPGLNSFPKSGNGLVTAFAVDYDMWRTYGFKEASSPINVPFLSDPNSQCAPYANILLSRNRKNILQGTLTISGNEFMQPGEVIFLEDRGMLFYVNSVKHSISMGSSFSTTLELTYGHTPGEYIPTVMDVIGKMIYKNKDIADLIIQRQESSSNDLNIGVIQKYKETSTVSNSSGKSTSSLSNEITTSDVTQKVSSLFTQNDAKAINNILYTTSYLINSNESKGNNINAKVELRIYHDNNNEPDKSLLDLADIVKKILIGERDDLDSMLGKNKNNTLPAKINGKDNVKIIKVNLDSKDDKYSPSQKAMNAARNEIANVSVSSALNTSNNSVNQENDKLRKALFSYIIDCWISIEQNS